MSDLVGKTIAGYQINELIDETAQALVYKGFQPSENRYVAVKVLKPEAAQNQAAVQSFNQYAQAGKKYPAPQYPASAGFWARKWRGLSCFPVYGKQVCSRS